MPRAPHYEAMADEALCALTAGGDRLAEEVLVGRYSRRVRVCARPFFLAGGDSEDLIQEGMFGLLKAIREFDPRRDASFRTFAEVCIRHRILSAIAAASRDKHAPLNESVPIEAPLLELGAAQDGALGNPEDLLIGQEERLERVAQIKGRLSALEAAILDRFLEGLSYREIARAVGRSEKSVDNAVQRIRRKLSGRA